MTSGFQQQKRAQAFTIPKVDALPQHGQKADKDCGKTPSASYKVTLRPAH